MWVYDGLCLGIRFTTLLAVCFMPRCSVPCSVPFSSICTW